MKHTVTIKRDTTKGHENGHGIVFVATCCGKYEKSGHIQAAGKFTPEELRRLRKDFMQEVAEQHHAHIRALGHMATGESDQIEVELD